MGRGEPQGLRHSWLPALCCVLWSRPSLPAPPSLLQQELGCCSPPDKPFWSSPGLGFWDVLLAWPSLWTVPSHSCFGHMSHPQLTTTCQSLCVTGIEDGRGAAALGFSARPPCRCSSQLRWDSFLPRGPRRPPGRQGAVGQASPRAALQKLP